jgi:hypothetical protein
MLNNDTVSDSLKKYVPDQSAPTSQNHTISKNEVNMKFISSQKYRNPM